MATIREYRSADTDALIALIMELQDSEKSFDSRLPPGKEIAARYFRWMMNRCRKYSGKVFVAEEEGKVSGFITALGRMKYTDPDAYPYEYTLISDLVVHAPYRNRGLGRRLLSRAEEYARELGVSSLQIEVTVPNTNARRLYIAYGFKEAWLELEKVLK